jgi:hypothetical protein
MDDPAVTRFRGFRLVDLLVVAGLLIILVGVVVSAVRKLHQAAAVPQCQNNLKTILLAIHDYASTYSNALPPLSGAPISNSIAHPQSLFLAVIPFVESGTLYKDSMAGPRGATWNGIDRYTGGPIFSTSFNKTFVCPADSSNSMIEPTAHGWVGSSYAANAQVFGNKAREIADPQSGQALWNALESIYNIGNIPAGTSSTIFVAERFALAGVPGADMPCSWVDPPAGGPALGNKDFDAMGCPLQPFVSKAGAIRASLGGPGTFYGAGTREDPVGSREGRWKYPLPEIGLVPTNASTDGRAQSQHPAVVQVGMGDGSARGFSASVDLRTWLRAIDASYLPPNPSDW